MTSVQPPRPDQPDPADYAYNLFRNKQRPDIICAVPEDRPVPHFIDQERWTFEQPPSPLANSPARLRQQGGAYGCAVQWLLSLLCHCLCTDCASGFGRSEWRALIASFGAKHSAAPATFLPITRLRGKKASAVKALAFSRSV